MNKDDGSPAFPARPTEKLHGGIVVETRSGMSLRDYFAAAVMHGLMSWDDHPPTTENCMTLARTAYELADVMLAERSK